MVVGLDETIGAGAPTFRLCEQAGALAGASVLFRWPRPLTMHFYSPLSCLVLGCSRAQPLQTRHLLIADLDLAMRHSKVETHTDTPGEYEGRAVPNTQHCNGVVLPVVRWRLAISCLHSFPQKLGKRQDCSCLLSGSDGSGLCAGEF